MACSILTPANTALFIVTSGDNGNADRPHKSIRKTQCKLVSEGLIIVRKGHDKRNEVITYHHHLRSPLLETSKSPDDDHDTVGEHSSDGNFPFVGEDGHLR